MSLSMFIGGRPGIWRKYFRTWVALFAAYLLAGCATTLSARVTSFQKWPEGIQNETYRLVRDPGQSDDLEYQAFADMIRASIGPVGLVEAKEGASARFDVSFSYGTTKDRQWVQRYADPYFPYGPWGYYDGWRGPFFGPPMVNVPVSVYKNTLTVRIKDNHQHGAEVYRSSAVSVTSGDSLVKVMPYLARAVFDHFPGNNGQVRTVNYEIHDH